MNYQYIGTSRTMVSVLVFKFHCSQHCCIECFIFEYSRFSIQRQLWARTHASDLPHCEWLHTGVLSVLQIT